MIIENHPIRSLKNKLSLLVTLTVVLALTAVGFYFDNFLKNNFLETTHKQIHQGFDRLSDNLQQIERQLKDGVAFAKDNESLIASIELINNYQDKDNYNTYLIDEEKKIIAQKLLDQVRLTFNTSSSLYDVNQELQVYVNNLKHEFSQSYITYDGGEYKILSRLEHESLFSQSQSTLPDGISSTHINYYDPAVLFNDSVITYHRYSNNIYIKSHQSIFDTHNGKIIAHIEMTRAIDKFFFEEFSKDVGINISFSFDKRYIDKASEMSDYIVDQIHQSKNEYISIKKIEGENVLIFFIAKLDKASIESVLTRNRQQLLVLLIVIAISILFMMRYLIHNSIALPLEVLMKQIRKINDQDYNETLEVTTGDELESISKSVNNLARVIQDREVMLMNSSGQLEFLSNHDSLTNLPNRRLFSQRLDHALSLAKRYDALVGVFFLDLDDFKMVNDTLGHEVGDELLRKVSLRLKKHSRESDTLARIGGDEFNIVVENITSDSELDAIAKKYLVLFQLPFQCFGHEIITTVSIGISRYPADGMDALSLVKHADLAMYKAKDSGRNNYSFFTDDLSVQIDKRASMITDLKHAVEDNNQFELFYQPKVSTRTGKPVSLEALIRWKSPKQGYIGPDQFIPIAEETGLILIIGKWVIKQACSDFIQLAKEGFELEHISINVSNVQLRNLDCHNQLKQIIKTGEIQAHQIEIEITESYIATDAELAIKMLQDFRDIGVNLAIDDFGTGYSSMSYLQKLPITRIKIDKSFIDGIPNSPDSITITRTIITLAKNLGLSITAEGVEHKDQLEFLKQEGCDEIQGYYYAKPMPLNVLRNYLSSLVA